MISLTEPIAPGDSIIAPRTASSASRFCGGTGAEGADGGAWATSERNTSRRDGATLGQIGYPQSTRSSVTGKREHLFDHTGQLGGHSHAPADDFSPGGRPLGAGTSRIAHRPVERPVDSAAAK